MLKVFTDFEKIQLFDKISALYFERNFGSTSKSDLETLLFSEYIEHCIREKEPFDDYTLSKQLGITQSRVRALKERKELKYPHEGFDWRQAFAEAVQYAKYDSNDHYVKVIIEDINVLTEVRHFIENKGWYDECSLNRKLLRIPLDCFAEICLDGDEIEKCFTDDTLENVTKIADSDSAVKAFVKDFSKDGFKKFLMTASKELAGTVIGLLPFGGVAKVAFDALGKIISKL